MTHINVSETNILIVDDTPANLHLLVGILRNAGYKVRPANNGPRALSVAKKEHPDLILLDVMMPEMDGYEVCEQLKADEHTFNIPIIFISSLNETFNKVKAFATGAVDYITKPFQVEEVLARVTAHITIRNQQKLLEAHNAELQKALAKVKQLSGLLPICANCKKIRDDTGYWQQVEVYIQEHSEADFSHGICPECTQKLYGDYY